MPRQRSSMAAVERYRVPTSPATRSRWKAGSRAPHRWLAAPGRSGARGGRIRLSGSCARGPEDVLDRVRVREQVDLVAGQAEPAAVGLAKRVEERGGVTPEIEGLAREGQPADLRRGRGTGSGRAADLGPRGATGASALPCGLILLPHLHGVQGVYLVEQVEEDVLLFGRPVAHLVQDHGVALVAQRL